MLLANAAVGVLPESLPPDAEGFERWYQATPDGPKLVVGDTARRVVENLRRRPLVHPALDGLAAAAFPPAALAPGPSASAGARRATLAWNGRRSAPSARACGSRPRPTATSSRHQARPASAPPGERPVALAAAVDRVGRRWAC